MSANYKDTLLLPKTDFPMKADLVKREPERLAKWEAAGIYQQTLDARKDAPLFVLHDGPPFANGDVHMGTALNKILKDLIVKSRHMLGFRAPFVPGWDCHGLPIEFKVVKESRGLAPAEIRRRAEEFARKYIDIQRGQFKRLGVFGSWSEPYLTLEPGYEAEIIRAFATFVDKGLVYQSKKPVYWSTGAQTALAEAEVEYAQRTDPAIWVKFRLTPESEKDFQKAFGRSGPIFLVIWTTTPWTLPANVAVAFNPNIHYVIVERNGQNYIYANTLGLPEELRTPTKTGSGSALGEGLKAEEMCSLTYQHPFLKRIGRVIAGDFVTAETGTGLVHIAPGHGKDDYIASQQQTPKLPVLSPVDDYGRFVQLDPEYDQMPEAWIGKEVAPMNSRAPDSANAAVIEELTKREALLAVNWEPHDYPHCWRSKTPIVFRAVEQFFIKVDDIRAAALAAIDETQWVPAWGRNRIYGTVESRPDWCISRQRTWGVPLPIFYDDKGTPIVRGDLARKVADLVEQHGTNLWFEKDDAWWANALGLPAGTSRRNDTLDVWIDSGVSHQAVTKKHPELAATGGVADVYLEATDQHRGWFQSSLMTSVALTGHAPYKTVITHGFVVDKDTKKKISKSAQGTYQKPMDAAFFVNKYGADIVRLWAASVNFTDDVPFSEESFTRISEAYRGFRNVLRILLANLHDFPAVESAVSADSVRWDSARYNGATTVDRWILSKLQTVIATCRAAYEAYDFRAVFETLNQFCTVELSALYVDITKDRMYCDAANSPRRRATQTVMNACVEAATKLLAPILAFTADEAWEFARRPGSVHVETFPQPDESLRDAALEAKVDEWLKLRGIIYQQAIEPARAAKTIAKSLESAVTLALPDAQHAAFAADQAELEEFFIVSELAFASAAEPAATVIRSGQSQCPRCWRHQPLTERGLCGRCTEALSA